MAGDDAIPAQFELAGMGPQRHRHRALAAFAPAQRLDMDVFAGLVHARDAAGVATPAHAIVGDHQRHARVPDLPDHRSPEQ